MLLLKRRYKQALEELNQVIVLYAWFLPALVEKFLVLVATGDWEQAVETAQLRQRAQHLQPTAAAQRLLDLVHSLAQEN